MWSFVILSERSLNEQWKILRKKERKENLVLGLKERVLIIKGQACHACMHENHNLLCEPIYCNIFLFYMWYLPFFNLCFADYQVLAKLEMFTKAITGKANASSNKSEGGEDDDVSDWKTVRLKFAPEHGKVSFFYFWRLQFWSFHLSIGLMPIICANILHLLSTGIDQGKMKTDTLQIPFYFFT